MLDFDSDDLIDMNDESGDEPEPAPTGHWIPTAHNDVLMVDTPENTDNEDKGGERKDKPSEKHSKRRLKRRAKPRLEQDPALERDDSADDEHGPEQPFGHENMEKKNLQERLAATTRSPKKQKQKAEDGRKSTQEKME